MSWKALSASMTLRFMAPEAMMARVDLPAPRSPVRTMEASESNTLEVENSGECGGELGAEREALEGEPAGVGGEGSYALTI